MYLDYRYLLCIEIRVGSGQIQNVIYNYASAVGIKKKDANLHLQLGMVLNCDLVIMKYAIFCFSLDQSRQWADGESPTDHLQNVIYNYASAVGIKKKDANLHLQLGMVLEEKYYIEDMFGLKKEVGVI